MSDRIKAFLEFWTGHFTLWVILFGLLAYRFPGPVFSLKGYLDHFFALTMFGIGAALRPADFVNIARSPGAVAVGSAAQYTIMPFSAWAIARILRLPDELAIGLVLTGAAPGAMASNVVSFLAKADTAYSVSLTTVSTLLCPVLTPLLVLKLAGAEMDVEYWQMFLKLLLTVIGPLLAGFGLRVLFPRQVEGVQPAFPALSALFIVFICSLVIAMNREALASTTLLVLAVCLALNLSGMTLGYGAGRVFRMPVSRRRTLSIEVGMQNAGLGVVLAIQFFGKGAALPCAAFVFICILTGSVAASWWSRRPVPDGAAPPATDTAPGEAQ
ncbi:MAG TPA: bile acid:sodium symporter family protein [Candidatus Hydrogenedentes bacterium]|nr:bile acid:sodium symporter family protein [Candidatus Hydrogenedentota bacterium]